MSVLPEIENIVGKELAAVMKNCDLALAAGAYEDSIIGILKWNKIVMAARKAAPWIQLNDGKLDVRYRGQEKVLPDGKMLLGLWRNSYFIDALKRIVFLLAESN